MKTAVDVNKLGDTAPTGNGRQFLSDDNSVAPRRHGRFTVQHTRQEHAGATSDAAQKHWQNEQRFVSLGSSRRNKSWKFSGESFVTWVLRSWRLLSTLSRWVQCEETRKVSHHECGEANMVASIEANSTEEHNTVEEEGGMNLNYWQCVSLSECWKELNVFTVLFCKDSSTH